MDTTGTTSVTTEKHEKRRAIRAIAALALVLLVLGATMDAVSASQSGRVLPQRTFIKNCQNSGGTPGVGFEDNAGSAWCTWQNPDGSITEVACEFTGSYLWHCTGQTRITSTQNQTTHGNLSNDVVLNANQTTQRRAQVVAPGAVLVLDDDQER
jgi:hypothetical protein